MGWGGAHTVNKKLEELLTTVASKDELHRARALEKSVHMSALLTNIIPNMASRTPMMTCFAVRVYVRERGSECLSEYVRARARVCVCVCVDE